MSDTKIEFDAANKTWKLEQGGVSVAFKNIEAMQQWLRETQAVVSGEVEESDDSEDEADAAELTVDLRSSKRPASTHMIPRSVIDQHQRVGRRILRQAVNELNLVRATHDLPPYQLRRDAKGWTLCVQNKRVLSLHLSAKELWLFIQGQALSFKTTIGAGATKPK